MRFVAVLYVSFTAAVLAAAVLLRACSLASRWKGRARSRDPVPETGDGGLARELYAAGGEIPKTLLFAAGTTIAAAGWGLLLFSILAPRSPGRLMTGIYSLVLGWGLVSHLLLALGVSGRLNRRWVGIVLAAGLGAGLAGISIWDPVLSSMEAGPVLSLPGAVASVFCLLLLWTVLPACFAPPQGFDAHAYHLELPRRYAATGSIQYVPFMAHSPWPQAVHLLLVPGFLFRSKSYPQVTSFIAGLAMIGMIFETTRGTTGLEGAFIAVLAFLAMGEVVYNMADANVDLGTAAFILASMLSLSSWLVFHDAGHLLLSGIFAGFAASAKITGLVWLAVAGTVDLSGGLLAGEGWAAPVSAGVLVLIASLVAAPWYLRSAWLTGNPIYHFATGLFVTRNWPESSVAAHRSLAHASRWGPVRGIENLIRYPIEHGLSGPLGWGAGILALGPAAMLCAVPRDIGIIASASLFFFAIMLLNTSQRRLMLASAAGFSILSGTGLGLILDEAPGLAWYLALVAAVVGGLALAGAWQINRHKLSVLLDHEKARGALRRFLPYYDDYSWINSNCPETVRILLWTTRGYLLRREYVWLPPWQQGLFDFTRIRNAEEFRHALKSHGITHVYFTEDEIDRKLFGYLYDLHEEMVERDLLELEKSFEEGRALFRLA